MHNVNYKKKLPYSKDKMYELVLNVEDYPLFLPWCNKINIIKSSDKELIVDMNVKFGLISSTYRSHIVLKKDLIEIKAIEGPFKLLVGSWSFKEKSNECLVKVELNYEFSSKILDGILSPIFSKIALSLINAFEERAKIIYSV